MRLRHAGLTRGNIIPLQVISLLRISSIVNKDVCVIGNIKKMNVHGRDTAPLSVVNFCGVGHHEDIKFLRFLYLQGDYRADMDIRKYLDG